MNGRYIQAGSAEKTGLLDDTRCKSHFGILLLPYPGKVTDNKKAKLVCVNTISVVKRLGAIHLKMPASHDDKTSKSLYP